MWLIVPHSVAVTYCRSNRFFVIGQLTNQKKSHLTYLLQLLKEHKPLIDFDRLPSSGIQLMFIDGRDMPRQLETTEHAAKYVFLNCYGFLEIAIRN